MTTRIRTVDGLRGFAALLVVFDHVVGDHWGLGAWSQQNHGITIFAILTGFLLSATFLRARLDGRPEPALVPYLRARVTRIYPAYWFGLAGAALLVGWHSMGPGDTWRVLTLTQAFGSDGPFEGIPPTWSLSMFLSFYLLLPVWSRLRRRADGVAAPRTILRRELAWLAGLFAFALVVRMENLTAPIALEPVYTVFGRADWFALGMLFGLITVAVPRGLAPRVLYAPGRFPGLVVLLGLGVTSASMFVPVRLEELRDQLDTLAAAIVIAAVVLHGERLRGIQRVLVTRPFLALGRWSFGIFVWGWIMQKSVLSVAPDLATHWMILATMGLAVVCGAVSYRFVEKPVLDRVKARGSAPAPAPLRPAHAA